MAIIEEETASYQGTRPIGKDCLKGRQKGTVPRERWKLMGKGVGESKYGCGLRKDNELPESGKNRQKKTGLIGETAITSAWEPDKSGGDPSVEDAGQDCRGCAA